MWAPVLLSLELGYAEQIIETHDLFILGLLVLRERPEVLLAASSITRPDKSFSTATKAASNLSKVCLSIPVLPPHDTPKLT